MAEKKKFLLRMDDSLYAALEKWAADDFRSINAQIEYLLKEALKKSGRANNGITTSDKTKNDLNNNSDKEN